MLVFLLVISFILHFIILYSIIILYRKQITKDEEISTELQTVLDSYLKEIKRENEKLKALVEKREEKVYDEQKKEMFPTYNYEFTENTDYESPEITYDYEPPVIPDREETKDQIETSLTAKILSLAEKGFNAEEIAKKLQCGKTEAELVLKFHQK